jgi:hypothetical protein
MTLRQRIRAATLALAIAVSGRKAMGQTARSTEMQAIPTSSASLENQLLENLDSAFLPGGAATPFAAFLQSTDFDIKFKLETLMDILRDSRHESWVLAAYPDPQTSRPLIGAGFNLDVKATEHLQTDPLNPHIFIEPSSAQLWQAAGLSSERLQIILDQFDRDLKAWDKKKFRRKVRTHQLPPELSEEEAARLLQISVVLVVHNARAYCREFDLLTASQQMALSQLVFQMGVNLEEFIQFLGVINEPSHRDAGNDGNNPETESEHWKAVQGALIQSDWARRYTSRAVAVIAMFDPDYDQDPGKAEHDVSAVLHPPVVHKRKKKRVK